ncbi:cation-transporting P-type ATPase, partial [Enterococcus lactis]|uniref:cation-transporting P-type ATPase n=1 Tax=Enterococcus lactis TaxID=357441 RepID=UPI0031CD32C2
MENKQQAEQGVYKETIDSLMQQTQSSTDGLSTTQEKEKLERHGLTQRTEKPKKPTWKLFFETFKDEMGFVLLIVGLIT